MTYSMKATIEKINPELAKSWLEQNVNFRNPLEHHVERMARDMRDGHWDENGESIKFNTKDQLVDGQNRLLACIKAGKPFVSVVVYGVNKDLNIDIGAKRSFAMYIKHHGCSKYQNDISAAVRVLFGFRKGTPLSYLTGSAGSLKATNEELIRLYKQDKDKLDIAADGIVNGHKGILPASLSITLSVLFSEKDADLCAKYFGALLGDLPFSTDDPIMILKLRLLETARSKYRMTRAQKAALSIIAWNHWRRGTACKILKWAQSGPFKQDFPAIE